MSLRLQKLLIICLIITPLFFSCNSKDHQVATLEKETPGTEQYLEQEGADAGENYEEYRDAMEARLDKNQELADRFKMNLVELAGEERDEYEQEIQAVEEQISSMRSELKEYDPAEDSEWIAFVADMEQRAEKLEEDLRQLSGIEISNSQP